MSSNRRLREVAHRLPPIQLYRNGRPVFEYIKKSGEDILKDNPSAKVNPDIVYKIAKPVLRNHEKEMLAIWKKFGQEGVDNYIAIVMEQYRMLTEKKVETKIENAPWWKKIWIAFLVKLDELRTLYKTPKTTA